MTLMLSPTSPPGKESSLPPRLPLRKPAPIQIAASVPTSPLHTPRHSSNGPASAGIYSAFPGKRRSKHSRHASTGGSGGLRRFTKALPSWSMPSFTLPSFTTPIDFGFSLGSGKKVLGGSAPTSPGQSSAETSSDDLRSSQVSEPGPSQRPDPPQRVKTQDSVFIPLERMSSLGDDSRWTDIKEQVNIRGKAFRESLPDIKVPKLSVLRSPLESGGNLESPTTSTWLPLSPASNISFNAVFPENALDKVLEQLEGDVVILGGYRGSILRSTDTRQQVWAPVKLGLNMRTPDLFVGLDPEDELRMEESIIPDGMLQHVGPVDVSRRLHKKLRNSEAGRSGRLRVHDYGYDWRLSPHLLSRKLVSFLETLQCNKRHVPADQKGAIVIAHSLGGLITRHAINSRPDLFSGVIYAGVPQRCVNILGPLRFGDPVLFNHDILTSRVNFSFRTSFAFLPEDGYCFVNRDTHEEYRVNFYDVDDWIKYRLCPEVSAPPLPRPEVKPATITAKMRRHGSLVAKRTRAFTFSPGQALTSIAQSATSAIRTTEQSLTQEATNSAHLPAIPGANGQCNDIGPLSEAELARNRAYLARVLAEVKLFRSELAHNKATAKANRYPPTAVIFAKNTPTLAGALIPGPEAIPREDAYDRFLFKSGDGVVLAREAMLPPGYSVVAGGLVEVQRGHLTLLGDLEGIGKALESIIRARKRGVGVEGRSIHKSKGKEPESTQG